MNLRSFFSRQFIRRQALQIFALVEKNLRLSLRFKFNVFMSFLMPIISIAMPLIILGKFFTLNAEFGPWNESTYMVFQLLAYQILLMKVLINEFPVQFLREKYWKTIPAIIIAPLNQYNLLLGIFFSHMILISIPFTIFFVLCWIVYPISFLTIISIIVLLFFVALIFSSIGLIIGAFAISNENIWKILSFGITMVFWLSCLTYPFEIFPNIIQQIINLNPLYYLFEILRTTWIENNILLSISYHPFNFLILFLTVLIFPIISVYAFKVIYKKFGIVGY